GVMEAPCRLCPSDIRAEVLAPYHVVRTSSHGTSLVFAAARLVFAAARTVLRHCADAVPLANPLCPSPLCDAQRRFLSSCAGSDSVRRSLAHLRDGRYHAHALLCLRLLLSPNARKRGRYVSLGGGHVLEARVQ